MSKRVILTPLGDVDLADREGGGDCKEYRPDTTSFVSHVSNFSFSLKFNESSSSAQPGCTDDLESTVADPQGRGVPSEAELMYESGLMLVSHLSKLLGSLDVFDAGFNDSKKKRKSFAAMEVKWRSIHSKAEKKLREALALYTQVDGQLQILSHIRHLLSRLQEDLSPPSIQLVRHTPIRVSTTTHLTTTTEGYVMDAGVAAMQKGMEFVKHLEKLAEASKTEHYTISENDIDKRRRRAAVIFNNKWRSIYTRAMHFCEEALKHFRKLHASTLTPTPELRNNLNMAKTVFERLLRGDLLPSPTHSSENRNSISNARKEQQTLQRARAAHEEGRRHWKHLSQLVETSEDYQSHPRRWAMKWRSMHGKATEALQHSQRLYRAVNEQIAGSELENVRLLLLQVQSSRVFEPLKNTIKSRVTATRI